MLRLVLAAGAAVALTAGCALPPQQETAAQWQARQPVVCQGETQCTAMWRRAQAWVAQSSRWAIRTSSDGVIATHIAPGVQAYRSYQVVRTPLTGGAEQISISSSCANLFGCEVTHEEAAARFRAFITAGL